MDEKIRRALHQAYEGEAKAALRLKVYADQADKEGYPQIAKLFRVMGLSEEIHGIRALRTLRDILSTEENLSAAFESEQQIAQVAYDQFIKEALEVGDKAAALHFTQSRDVEETHAKLYKAALNDMASDQESTYYVCTICGYIADGALPDACPVCGAKKERFIQYG